MNWQTGLIRISAVWWGFWGLIALLVVSLYAVEHQNEYALMVLALLVPLYLLHRLTCWIIGGFFS